MNALWGLVLGSGIFEAISGAAISLTQNLRAGVEIGLILHVLIGAVFLFPLSLDPARNSQGMIHSHRFIAANTTIPWLRHDEKQMALTQAWLKGFAYVPEIESRWRKGATIQTRIKAPSWDPANRRLRWTVVITNNKAGHSFPTGPLDLIEAWLEVTIKAASGKILYHSGGVQKDGSVDPRAFFLRAIGRDIHGRMTITRHNLWDMTGMKIKRSIFVGASQSVPYEFMIAPRRLGPLVITANLRYRKFNQNFIRFLVSSREWIHAYPKVVNSKNFRFPIVTLSKAKAVVELEPAKKPR